MSNDEIELARLSSNDVRLLRIVMQGVSAHRIQIISSV